jgi:hypothetical protein
VGSRLRELEEPASGGYSGLPADTLAQGGYSLLESGEGPLVHDPSGNALVLALA